MTLIESDRRTSVIAGAAASGVGAVLVAAGLVISYFGVAYLGQTHGGNRVVVALAIVIWTMLVLVASVMCWIQTYRVVRDRVCSRRRLKRSRGDRRSPKLQGTV